MPDKEIMEIAEKAFMIVNGYAFSKKNETIAVLNLNNPNSAMLLSKDGKMLVDLSRSKLPKLVE